jgi:hypothetical protein
MPKKTLVEIALFDKLFNLFIDAKSKKKEHEFIKNMTKKDPELGKLYSDWNNKMDTALNSMKSLLQSKGLDTSKVDNVLNKRY